jgi:hypothetical protein
MRLNIVLPITAVCFLSGCDDYQIAEKSKEVVISKAEYEQLQATVAENKQVGRYQLHREGARTWRLDTATGRSCLLLTTDADWKGQGAQQNACYIEDYAMAQERHKLHPSLFDAKGDPIPSGVTQIRPCRVS